MKIEDVELYRVTGAERDTPEIFKGVSHSDQLDLYPDIAKNKGNLSERPAKPVPSVLYVEVQSENGLSGISGPIQGSQAYVIQSFLRPILIGEDALATEALLDKMMRLHRAWSIRHVHDRGEPHRLRSLGSQGQAFRPSRLPPSGRTDEERGAGLRQYVRIPNRAGGGDSSRPQV